MSWLDLAVICLLIWGGISGCLQGWRKAAWRFAALAGGALLAGAFQREVQAVLISNYQVDHMIKAIINRRLAVPVYATPLEGAVPGDAGNIPAILRQLMQKEPALAALSSPAGYSDLLAQLVFNSIAFALALLVWGSFLYLIAALLGDRFKQRLSIGEQLGGFLVGAVRSFLALVLATGLLLPLLMLTPFPWEPLGLEQAKLFSAGLQLFVQIRGWWP